MKNKDEIAGKALGARIEERLTQLGLSQSMLARRVGISQPTINQIMNGEIRRSKYLPEIAQELKTNIGWLLTGTGDPNSNVSTAHNFNATPNEPDREGTVYSLNEDGRGGRAPRRTPVYGFASGANEKHAINWEHEQVIDWVDTPPWLQNINRAAALRIMGDSMEPRYYAGETIFVNRSLEPAMGEDCVVDTRDGETHIKRFLRRDKEFVHLYQYNPPGERKFLKKDVLALYAIVGRR